jgi:hypothetical protein
MIVNLQKQIINVYLWTDNNNIEIMKNLTENLVSSENNI